MENLDKTAILTREHSITYAQLLAQVNAYAALTPKGKDTKTVIFSENREGWIYAFYAVWQNQGVAIPVDAGSTVSDLAYILRDAEPDAIWTSRSHEQVTREAVEQAGGKQTILLIDDYEALPVDDTPANSFSGKEASELYPWKSLFIPDNKELALIIYTSGTTGSPKGVMLSYQNMMANLISVSRDVPIYTPDRSVLILLPLHHVLPLMGTLIIPLYLHSYVVICPTLAGPDIMEMMCKGKVGIMIGVPRLWQTLYGTIKKKIDAGFVTRMLFSLCSTMGSRRLSKFVFQSIKKMMGGHLDFCVSGGAALEKEIGQGLKTLGFDMLEGYGMTECAPIISFTRPYDFIPGSAGKMLPCMAYKLVNGELCAKGPNVMLGYYNRPHETAKVIDSEGYLHTGDLAHLDESGHVYITGRSKEIIILSNGKNVQPSEIEYKLEKADDKVKECAVVQDGDLLRAIIVPQTLWAGDRSDRELEVALKREVLEPYNLTVANYKKLMSVMVFRGELPRTKLDKLQRFKLKDLLQHTDTEEETCEEPDLEEYRILRDFIQNEKKIRVKPFHHLETDLAMDSLDKVSLQGFLEHSFGIRLEAEQLAVFPNVEALARFVAGQKTRQQVEDIDWNKLLNEDTSHLQLPIPSFMYPVAAKSLKGMLCCYNSLKVSGQQNIPLTGPYILAPNHQSFVDAPIAISGLSRKQLKRCYFYATESHVRSRFRKFLARNNNVILMERANLKDSILKLAKVLKSGRSIVIFPEGSRTHDGDLSTFKKTFAILALELQVPIVPVCIRGAFEALPRDKHFLTPHHIEVEYLLPVFPNPDSTYESLTESVYTSIQKALKK